MNKGYLYALGSAIAGGSIPVLSKLLLESTKPLVISSLAFLLCGLILVPYKPKSLPKGKNIGLIVTISMVGAAFAPALYFFGVSESTAVNAALLTNSEVFFTAVIAFALFHETLRRSQLVEGLLILIGVVVISVNLQSANVAMTQGLTGSILIIAASVLWGVDNNLSRIASQRLGALMVARFKGLVGGGIIVLFLFISSTLVIPASAIPLIIVLGFVFAVTTSLSLGALRIIGAVRTLLIFSTSSLFGPMFAFVVLGEGITEFQVIGGAFILAGAYLIQRSEGSLSLPEGLGLDANNEVTHD